MAFYRITNVTEVNYSSASLDLNAGETVVVQFPTVPADLNTAIVAEELIVVKLSGGIGDPDSGTDVTVTEIVTAASLVSQAIAPVALSLVSPGRYIINRTAGDVAIRLSSDAASFSEFSDILAPEEAVYVAADYLGEITAICEVATGNIVVEVFF